MASKRNQRRKACSGKIAHATLELATTAAFSLRRAQPGDSIGAYRCQFCGNWHIGHAPKQVRQAIRARRAARYA